MSLYALLCFNLCVPSLNFGSPRAQLLFLSSVLQLDLALLLAGSLVFISLSYQISYHPSICFSSSKIWWISLICWCLSQSSLIYLSLQL